MSPVLMPRSLADPLYERLLRSFPATQAYTRADWEDEAMPEPVAHFLGQLLRHHSRREARRLRRARSDWVDYDHPDMEQAVRTFFNAMETHTQVPASDWEATLRQATYHSTAHLVRPVHVLTDFVYADQEKALRMPEVLWRMNFFGPYGYLREAVHAFSKKRNLDALDPKRFDRFLHRIDERITANYSADRWLRLLAPLFQIARRATGDEQVPTSLIEAFFAEKGHTRIEQRVATYARNGHGDVGAKELRRLIEEARSTSPSSSTQQSSRSQERPPAAPEESPPEPARPASDPSDDDIWGVSGRARPEGSGQPQSQSDDESVPLWKRFQQGGTSPPSTGNAAPENPSAGNGDSGGNGTQTPLWARFRGEHDERLSEAVSETAESSTDGTSGTAPSHASSSRANPDEGLEALEQEALGVSNPPHRAVYVRQLFGGDRTAYKRVLRRLSGADSWSEASQIIAGDVFRTHKVNIYSDAAVHFTNAIESRFRQ